MTEMLRHALAYAERKIPVFPCDPANKRPLTLHGFKDASTEPDAIGGWWQRWPDAMIGLPTGRRSGVWAVDPDVPDEPGEPDGLATWDRLVQERGYLPHTHTHLTPRGGKHVVFRWEDERPVTNKEGQLAGTGINVRGEGGYIIAAPSRRNDGREYILADDFDAFNFAAAPDWLYDLVLTPKARAEPTRPSISERARASAPPPDAGSAKGDYGRYVGVALDRECETVRSAPKGGRNNVLNAAAFSLGTIVGAGHLAEGEARERLYAAAADAGLVAEDGERATINTINSGLGAGRQKPREMPEPRTARSAEPRRHGMFAGFTDGQAGDDNDNGGHGSDPGKAQDEAGEPAERPIIEVVAGELPRIVNEAETAIIISGLPVFVRAGELVRPVTESARAAHNQDTTVAKFRAIPPAGMIDLLSDVATFEVYDRRSKGMRIIDPPMSAASILLQREGTWRLPRVAGIITTPTLRADGSILSTPGYDSATRLYFAPNRHLDLPSIPQAPTRSDAEQALRLLVDLLKNFPFVGDVDRAVALSGLITAVVRGACSAAPLHAMRAHTPGTGKSLLVDVASTIATGRPCPVISAGKTEEETEKRLGALLRDGVPIVSIDNVNGELGGDALCQMLTQALVRIRILGKSEAPEFESKASVFATGNNLTLLADMTRRAVLCTLDAEMERPELRHFDFDPIARVMGDRGRYVAAALTIARAYAAAGRPSVCPPIGSFPDWSAVVRAPLVWLDQADPVDSMETARAEDPELIAIRELLQQWHEHFGPAVLLKAERVKAKAEERSGNGSDYEAPELRDLVLRQAGAGGSISSKSLGRWLSRIAGRVVEGRKIMMVPDTKHGNRFRLENVEAREAEPRTSGAQPVF